MNVIKTALEGVLIIEPKVFTDSRGYFFESFSQRESEGGITILDDSLGIDWRIPTAQAILSEKDTKHTLLKDFDSPF